MHKKLLAASLAFGMAVSPAIAQVNAVPQVGLTTGYLAKTTYSATWFGLVPPASATDLVCITGSASKVIRVMSIKLSGSAGTTLSLPATVLRRATADTGGTAGTTTANPANTISSRDTGLATNTSATATLISYTAVPTINDTSPVYIDSQQWAISLTTMATVSIPVYFDWSKDIENNVMPPTLRGAAQQLCVNLNSISISSGVVTGSITWTEE